MMSYEALQAYQKRLRKTIFRSADVLPERVATYLKSLATRGSHREIEEALETYPLLVKYLASDYVAFALAVLLMDYPVRRETGDPHDIMRWSSSLRIYQDNLGIREHIRCFPPAHIQGPFLALLWCNEHEGLRLIHALANKAVGVWRQRAQDFHFLGQPRTPLPVVLPLSSGPHTLWGDERVYSWYRPSTNAPDMVVSALMALEVWLEEQVIAGKNPNELFERVLGDSDCVAIAGICLGVALAFPEQCLAAALPLVSSPAIWRLDMDRAAQDRRPPLLMLYHDYKLIYDARAERDQRPQRQRTLPFLAGYYLFANDSLKATFEQAVTCFPQHIPFLFEDERDDPASVSHLTEWVEQLQACRDYTNYRQQQVDGQVQMFFDPPPPSQEETERSDSDEPPKWYAVALWTQQTLREGKQAEGMTAIKAITMVRGLQEDLQKQPVPSRLISAVAAVGLVADFQNVQEHGLLPWCREHLLSIVRQEGRAANFYAYPSFVSDSVIDVAVKGLVMLVERSMATEEVREALLSLTASPYEDVRLIILQRLDSILTADEELCWNILSLAISLHLVPRQLAVEAMVKLHNTGEQSEGIIHWEESVIETHFAALKQRIIPELPRIPVSETMCYLWDKEGEMLNALPLGLLCSHLSAKTRLLQLTGDLLVWTFAVNDSSPEYAYVYREPHPMRPYEWNRFFIAWIVRLIEVISQEEKQQFILLPLLEQWDVSPHLVKDLTYNYTRHAMSTLGPLPSSSRGTWRFLCDWIFDNNKLISWANGFSLEASISDVVGDIIFAGLTSEWPHASLFRDIIEKWVNIIGGNAAAYPSLLKFLRGPGNVFVPDPGLLWMSHCVSLSPQKLRFWQTQQNAERTARLLQYMWDQGEEKIRDRPLLLKTYTDLVDQLVGVGIPLANVLQQKLELRQ